MPGTDEDVECYTFRVSRKMGSVCCKPHHVTLITLCLAHDHIDSEIMWAGVRSCTSMRWANLPISEWLDAHRENDIAASRKRFALHILDEIL